MNPLLMIDELSVLVITLLMMCLSTLWYSKYLFGGVFEQEARVGTHEAGDTRYVLVGTFVSYFLILMGVAFALAVGEKIALHREVLSVGMWIGASAALLPSYMWEKRSLRLYAVMCGFLAVLIIGGAYLLSTWVW
jgi:hypothetical protein